MALQVQPNKYRIAAEDFKSGDVAFEALLDFGLEAFLFGEPVADASDDDLKILVLSGPGGCVMAALLLLATEPGLGSTAKAYRPMLVNEFRPMLVACRDQPWDTVVRLDPDTMLGQSYLRQAMAMVALLHKNQTVASDIITLGHPPARCLFAMLADATMPEEWKLHDKMLLELIAHGWLSPHLVDFLQRAFVGGTSAMQFISALCDAQETSPTIKAILAENQDDLLEAVASRGDPRTLDYLLRRLGRLENAPNFLVPASTKAGSKGSVAMLRYLIEERGMDIDWMKTKPNDAGASNRCLDIRERGYPEPLADSATALHGAASNGDIDALKYLLKRGAHPYRRDGKNKNPEQTAVNAKQDRVVAIIRAFGMRHNWESL
ncbi:hypothetical protein BX600DRAFT_512745 [Xylariales sp. PMI_506]|nr:hypothetical protein BX600DRAFT_512745 [Xylariales sp. PMI_506]